MGRRSTLYTYRSYNFVDKDPVIDELRTLLQREGFMKPGGYRKISLMSDVSQTTLWNWFDGKTRRPQNAPLEAVARSLGYKRTFTKTREINFENALKKISRED